MSCIYVYTAVIVLYFDKGPYFGAVSWSVLLLFPVVCTLSLCCRELVVLSS
jgi:hypothetical protein